MSWRDHAACFGTDTEMFFASEVGDQKRSYANLKKVRAICDSCPVKTECLQEAVDNNLYGIWGGTTEAQRIEIRKRRRGEAA